MEPRPPENRPFIPQHWQFPERRNLTEYVRHRVSVPDNYLSLVPAGVSPYNVLFTESKVEYFFNESGIPIGRRLYQGDGSHMTFPTDIPSIEMTVEVEKEYEPDEDRNEYDINLAFENFYDRLSSGKHDPSVAICYIDNNLAGVHLYTFIEGFSDDTSPEIAFIPQYDPRGNLIELTLDELEPAHQERGWQLIPSGSDHALKKDGEELFVVRRNVDPSGRFLIEQEYRKSDSVGFGARKIIRGDSVIGLGNYNQLIAAALAETLFDHQRNRVIHAPWIEADSFIGNPQISYAGPVVSLLRELREK